MTDAHAHLELSDDPGELLARARAAGVTRVVAVASEPGSGPTTLALCEREEGVVAALGLPPSAAARAGSDELAELRELLAHPKAVAVGETGLDFYRDVAPRDLQERLFMSQLELAAELGKPVVIHCRDAAAETAALLAGFAGTVVLHCFSSPQLLEPALERGYYLSFAGNVTYPSAGELRDAARHVPADRLLVETDAPYLAPQPLRGRRNEPAYVVHTLAALAEIRGEDLDRLERTIDANATVAFDLP